MSAITTLEEYDVYTTDCKNMKAVHFDSLLYEQIVNDLSMLELKTLAENLGCSIFDTAIATNEMLAYMVGIKQKIIPLDKGELPLTPS